MQMTSKDEAISERMGELNYEEELAWAIDMNGVGMDDLIMNIEAVEKGRKEPVKKSDKKEDKKKKGGKKKGKKKTNGKGKEKKENALKPSKNYSQIAKANSQ
jgi:hypothetical protein